MTKKILSSRNIKQFLKNIIFSKTQCFSWTNLVDDNGYGIFCPIDSRGKFFKIGSHRFSYMIFNGDIPKDMVVDHICRNRKCINPYHLRIVTKRINVLENSIGIAAENVRKKRCPRGHPYSGKDNRGKRICKICSKNNYKKWYKKNGKPNN